MIIWKNISINLKLHYSIKTFIILSKQCYYIVWSAEKIQKVKIQVLRTKNRRIMFFSNCEVCDSKKSKFIKVQEASALMSC